MQTPRSPLQPCRTRRLEALLFGLLGFLVSLVVSRLVFQEQLLFTEEANALFQAGNFIDGCIKRAVPVFHSLMGYEGILLQPETGWMSRCSPEHPLWLVPGVWLGWPHLMTALAAALSLGCAYEVGRRLRIPRLLMPGLLLISPFFLLLHGTLLPQTSGLALMCLLSLGYVGWRQDRTPLWAALAGAAWGLLLLNRSWTAALVLIPFAVDVFLQASRDWRNPRQWAGTLLFVGMAAVGVMLALGYNLLATGDVDTAPWELLNPRDSLGFGLRGVDGVEVDHTLLRGVDQMWGSIRRFDRWLVGIPFSLLVWLALVVHGWSRRWSGILLGAVGGVTLVSAAYWNPGLTDVGPVVFAELLLPVLLLGCLGLSRIWRRSEHHPRIRLALFCLAYVAVAGPALRFMVLESRAIRERHDHAWQVASLLDELPADSLVLVDPAEDMPALGFNPRGMDSRVLQLASREKNDPALAACFPDRDAYRLHLTPFVEMEPMQGGFRKIVRTAPNSHHARGTGRNEGDWRVAAADKDEPGFLMYGWYPYLPPGDYEAHVDIRWDNVNPDAPIRIEVMTDFGRQSLGQQLLSAGLENAVVSFHLPAAAQVEPRVYFGGSGSVRVRSIELERMTPTRQESPEL